MFWNYYYPILFLVLSGLILFFGLRKEFNKYKQLQEPSVMDKVYFGFNFMLVVIFGGVFFAGSLTRLAFLISKG